MPFGVQELLRRRMLFHDNHVRVEVDRMKNALEGIRPRVHTAVIAARRRLDIESIEVLKHPRNIGSELVVDAMDILADEDSPWPDMRQELLHSDSLLMRGMSTVVDHNVENWIPLAEPPPKIAIGLVTDEHSSRLVLVLLRTGLDVQSDDVAAIAEVISPHFEGTAAIDADLEQGRFLADELRKMPFVGLEIMSPLRDAPAFRASIEVVLEPTWLRSRV
jgi:hypothetical protein